MSQGMSWGSRWHLGVLQVAQAVSQLENVLEMRPVGIQVKTRVVGQVTPQASHL